MDELENQIRWDIYRSNTRNCGQRCPRNNTKSHKVRVEVISRYVSVKFLWKVAKFQTTTVEILSIHEYYGTTTTTTTFTLMLQNGLLVLVAPIKEMSKEEPGADDQWRQLVPCVWFWHSYGSLIQSRFDPKIIWSMKRRDRNIVGLHAATHRLLEELNVCLTCFYTCARKKDGT